MQTLQPTKPPKFQRAHHPLSVVGGLTLKQRKERLSFKPMPLEMHQYLAWAIGVSRQYSNRANKWNKAHGAVTALKEIEFWLDEVIMTEMRGADDPWRQYYQWAHGGFPIDDATCDPVYSLMLVFGLLEHTKDLHKMDPRYIKIRDLADYAIGKYSRGKARSRH